MRRKKVAIIGAGPGGLTLARILCMNEIDVSVFERDAFDIYRPQGGSLDMHAESGQYAITCADLFSEFKQYARYEDQEARIYNKHGELQFLDDDVTGKDRPEIDRGQLREIFLKSIPAETIRWNHEFQQVKFRSKNEDSHDDGVEVIFKNGARETADLVVGADGARSRVRPLISDVTPIYTGVSFVTLGLDDVDEKHPQLARLIGRGMSFALGDSKAIIGHRDANAHLGIYVCLRISEEWLFNGDFVKASKHERKTVLAKHFDAWSSELLQLIHQSGDSMIARGVYSLPPGHRWKHKCGVTLLGDAAHLMTPFGGNGANLAMQDGAELGIALTSNDNWDEAVRLFEEKMFERAEGPAADALGSIGKVFSEHGLNHILEQFKNHENLTLEPHA
jgi:2-polyprenyl-6-methoxyphenol hydroxylase-like FAD-dependent oxidoreductase